MGMLRGLKAQWHIRQTWSHVALKQRKGLSFRMMRRGHGLCNERAEFIKSTRKCNNMAYPQAYPA